MSALKDLVAAAAKVAADSASKPGGVVKETLSLIAAVTAGEAADKTARKLNLYRTNRWGEEVLKIPFFKTTDDKILKAFAKHPERKKVCFHYENTRDSLKKGVMFYDPEGNVIFSIPENKKNLRGVELYHNGRFAGRISKHVTFNLNPLSDMQKYDLLVHNTSGTVRVRSHKASVDGASWTMNHKIGKDYIIEDAGGKEIARFYSLGFANYVFDYDSSVDPIELILAFIAIEVRTQETHENHHGDKGKLLGSFTGDLKDIF